MKSFLLTIALLCNCLCSTVADGYFVFANYGGGANSPIFDWDGTNKLCGLAFAADLYYGPPGITNSTLLTPLRQPSSFLIDGYFLGGSRIIPGDYAAGETITVQVRVWDVPDGDSYEAVLNSASPTARVGQSELFPLMLDWPPGMGNSLNELVSFKTVPVQTNPPARPLAPPLSLATVTTNNLVFSWPSYWQAWTFALQQRPSLSGGNWLTLTNTPTLSGSQSQVLYQIEVPAPSDPMFYRLVSQ